MILKYPIVLASISAVGGLVVYAWVSASRPFPVPQKNSLAGDRSHLPAADALSEHGKPRSQDGLHLPPTKKYVSEKQFLAADANSSNVLGALYRRNRDPKYIAALKDRLLTDPQAAIYLAILAKEAGISNKDLRDSLFKAHSAFPDSALLTACLASTDATLGDKQSAFDLVRTISDSDLSGFQQASNDRQQAARDLLEEGGVNSSDAWKIAADEEAKNVVALGAFVLNLGNAIKGTDSVSATGMAGLSEDDRIDIVSGVAALARALNPDENIVDANGIIALNLERDALRTVPPQTPYGESGQTAADRIAAINADFQYQQYVQANVYPYLNSAPPGVEQGFLERKQLQGSMAALKWVENLMAASK